MTDPNYFDRYTTDCEVDDDTPMPPPIVHHKPAARRMRADLPTLAFRVVESTCWYIAAALLCTLIYACDVLDYLMQAHP